MNLEGQFREKLKEISEVLDQETSKNKEIGVLSGTSGVALFQFYYSRFLDDDVHADKGVETITKMVDYINNGFNYPTFCTGIAGACWVLEILREEDFVELDEDFLSHSVDGHLLEAMRADIKDDNFDFLHGAMGYGFYFLKRYQNITSEASKKKYKAYLDELILALKESSIKEGDKIWWDSVLKKEEEVVGCNLSLSHGIASNINFLSRLATYDEFFDDVKDLIAYTSNYILDYKNKDTSLTSTFPNWIVAGEVVDFNSRLAWCYGDLGIGISLLRVAETLKDQKLYEESIRILQKTTHRRDKEEASVIDAGLCHGAYGVLQIYNYLYKKTGDSLFKAAADFWAQEALQMATIKEGYAGYAAWQGAKEEWLPEVSLLEGVAGIGLTILSYLTPSMAKWDECLLIS